MWLNLLLILSDRRDAETAYLYSIDGLKIHANNAQLLPKMKLEGEVNYLIRETPSIHNTLFIL